jgi:hypothetical protein
MSDHFDKIKMSDARWFTRDKRATRCCAVLSAVIPEAEQSEAVRNPHSAAAAMDTGRALRAPRNDE